MGQLEKSKQESKPEKRGAVNNEKRLAQLTGKTQGGTASWERARPEWLAAIVILVSSAGGAVRFGLSRDKGSYSVGLYLGQENETLWFNGSADLDDELGALYQKLAQLLQTS